MTYLFTPCGVATGHNGVIFTSLKDGFETSPESSFLNGPLDAIEFFPAGSVCYHDWGPEWTPMPYHQRQYTIDREPQ